jgi:hypothetical protein
MNFPLARFGFNVISILFYDFYFIYLRKMATSLLLTMIND